MYLATAQPSELISADPFIPPRIRQDWPELHFGQESQRGMTTQALGIELSSVFQPLFNTQQQIVGSEALLRARSQGLQIPPISVFRIAAAQGTLVALDRLCRTLHLLNFLAYPHPYEHLYLNVHPRLIAEVFHHGVVFEEILASVHWFTEQITLEFSEHELKQGEPARLRDSAQNYRQHGFGLAIDHFGQDLTQLGTIEAMQPDLVKIDLALLDQNRPSRLSQQLSQLVSTLHQANIAVALTGIETIQHNQIASDAGIDLRQGFFLARPTYSKKE